MFQHSRKNSGIDSGKVKKAVANTKSIKVPVEKPKNLDRRKTFSKKQPVMKEESPKDSSRFFPVEGRMLYQQNYLSSDDEIAPAPLVETKEVKPLTQHRPSHSNQFGKLPLNRPRVSQCCKTKPNLDEPSPNHKSGNDAKNLKNIIGDTIVTNTETTWNIESEKKTADRSKTSDLLRTGDSRFNNESESNSKHLGHTESDSRSKGKSTLTQLLSDKNEGTEEFFEGTIIKGVKVGFCRILYSSMIYKEGFFSNGLMEGEGCIKFPNGFSVIGTFRQNHLSANICLSIDNTTFPIDYVEGEYHNNQIFVNDKNVIIVTIKPSKNIKEYTGKVKVYFRNGYKLFSTFDKGVLSETAESILYDKVDTPIHGKIRHAAISESSGMYIFKPNADPEGEYLLLLKGEGTAVKKHKR